MFHFCYLLFAPLLSFVLLLLFFFFIILLSSIAYLNCMAFYLNNILRLSHRKLDASKFRSNEIRCFGTSWVIAPTNIRSQCLCNLHLIESTGQMLMFTLALHSIISQFFCTTFHFTHQPYYYIVHSIVRTYVQMYMLLFFPSPIYLNNI